MFKDSSDKLEKYAAKGETDGIDNLTERLSADLRKSIKSLGSFAVLSDPWLEMSEVFGRIAHISEMEAKLAQPKGGGTLWETEEQALRYLLEDGKLNLCLRNLIEYKEYQRRYWLARETIDTTLLEKCDNFEKGLGVLLRNAWSHTEAIQTSDLASLVHYIIDVLETMVELRSETTVILQAADAPLKQEYLVFIYLSSLMRNIESVPEETLMAIVRSRRLFMTGIAVLQTYHANMPKASVLRMAEAMSLITESENFSSYYEEYIDGRSDAEALQSLKVSCLVPLTTADGDARRMLRSLLDSIDKAQRKYNRRK